MVYEKGEFIKKEKENQDIIKKLQKENQELIKNSFEIKTNFKNISESTNVSFNNNEKKMKKMLILK